MIWEQEPLFAKARLFFQRASNDSSNEPLYGLWCSLCLELLARAALASISPTLLAKPDNDHKHLLHALDRGSEKNPRISISATKVFGLCNNLFAEFDDDDEQISLALTNRRNEELHSGGAAFEEYPSSQWLTGFYHACNSLCSAISVPLESLFGTEEADVAQDMMSKSRQDAKKRVNDLISAHKTAFLLKSSDEQEKAKLDAESIGSDLATKHHHRVTCPACGSIATVQGRPFGKEYITNNEDEIIVKQAVAPKSFSCSACGLTLDGYVELEVAGLGGHYTRKTTVSPEEYYGLISPYDLDSYIEEYLGSDLREFDNE